VGVLDAPELTAYVDGIGRKLLRGLPSRRFRYRFAVVDQMEPNAFALPGGYIFVSRGLLALANDEDELACVLGHEIVHAHARHAAQQQSIARAQGFSLPFSRAARLAAYGRDMEREADEIGQQLCAAAGYDPMGLSTFLRSLSFRERMLIGHPRRPTFRDTHPGASERAATSAVRAHELRWQRDPALGDVRARLLAKIDGMLLGERPETGVFDGTRFLHPELGFTVRFPPGWELRNTARAVGAIEPRGRATVHLEASLPPGDLVETADAWSEKLEQEAGARLVKRQRLQLGDIPAVRYGYEAGGGYAAVQAFVTFFPFREATWQIVALARSADAGHLLPQTLATTRSFRRLAPEDMPELRLVRLDIVRARPGETFAELGGRSDNVLPPDVSAIANGLLVDHRFAGGELVKVAVAEAYTPESTAGSAAP